MSKSSTIDEITQYLAKNSAASVKDLSQALQSTEQNIRYHLEKMIKSGLVHSVKDKELSTKSSGRKRLLYSLNPNAHPNNHVRLLDAILKAFKNNSESNQLELTLRAIVKEMFPENKPNSSQVERLNDAIEQLNFHYYMAHWEAGFEGPLFIFQHCPYASLISTHPELCQLDCLSLQLLTGISYARLPNKAARTGCMFSPKQAETPIIPPLQTSPGF